MRSEAQKKAYKKYRKNLKQCPIVFSLSDIELYDKAQERAREEGTTAPRWVKNLIKKELENEK